AALRVRSGPCRSGTPKAANVGNPDQVGHGSRRRLRGNQEKQKAQSPGLIRSAEPSLSKRLLRAFAVRFFFDGCRLSQDALRRRPRAVTHASSPAPAGRQRLARPWPPAATGARVAVGGALEA